MGAKAKILIVEDENLVAQDIGLGLENYGYEVCAIVDTGPLALEQALAHKPDLILMDIKIKGEWDGIATAQRIWELQSVPVIYLSAYSDQATLERAKQTRPFAYLLKPFNERELYVAIEIALSKRPASPLLELPHQALLMQCQRALAAATFQSNLSHQMYVDFEPFQARLTYPADAPSLALLERHGDDLSTDIFDILWHLQLQQVNDFGSGIIVHADDCLRFRNLQAQKSGTGKRGGYELQWRQNILLQLQLLSAFQLVLPDHHSPLLTFEAMPAAFTWKVTLGAAIWNAWQAMGQPVMLLPQKTLAYDPYRQKWEKRLSRYLAWCWGEKSFTGSTSLTIAQLLQILQIKVDYKNPIRTKERLELALNTLKQDDLVAQWRYSKNQEQSVGKKGWLQAWFGWELNLQPPPSLMSQYLGFRTVAPMPPPRAHSQQAKSWAFLKYIRQERGLSQQQLTEVLGISQSQLSAIERGESPGPTTVAKIKGWIIDTL